MQTEPLPIERFIYQKIQVPRIKKVIEPMNLDTDQLLKSLVKVFVDMGVFLVHPGQDRAIERALLAEIQRFGERRKQKGTGRSPKHAV